METIEIICHCIDYLWLFGFFYVYNEFIFINDEYSYLASTKVAIFATPYIYLREYFYFWFLGDKIAAAKRKYDIFVFREFLRMTIEK